jgi:hypothetical protein
MLQCSEVNDRYKRLKVHVTDDSEKTLAHQLSIVVRVCIGGVKLHERNLGSQRKIAVTTLSHYDNAMSHILITVCGPKMLMKR